MERETERERWRERERGVASHVPAWNGANDSSGDDEDAAFPKGEPQSAFACLQPRHEEHGGHVADRTPVQQQVDRVCGYRERERGERRERE